MAKTNAVTTELQNNGNTVVTKEGNVVKKVESAFTHETQIHNSKLPLATNLITTEVKDKTLVGFYKQISTNMSVGMKAYYFVCRDLAIAEKTLKNEFSVLKEKLIDMFSRSTFDKYLEIGKSERIHKLFDEGKLPISWTTQYEIATMGDIEFDKVKPKLTPTTPMRVIDEIINDKDSKSESENDTKWDSSIFEKSKKLCIVDVEYRSEDYVVMKQMVNDIEKIVKKYNGQSSGKTMSTNAKKFNSTFNTNLLVNEDYIDDVELNSIKFEDKVREEEEKREKTRKEAEQLRDSINLEKMTTATA